MILLNKNNDNKYNLLIDKTIITLNYLLSDLLPSSLSSSLCCLQKNNKNKENCIIEIIEIIPNIIDIDTFDRISLFYNIMNGLIYLLNGLILRNDKKSNKKNIKQ